MSTIFDALKSDHDRQRALLTRLADTSGDSVVRRELFATLKIELEAHARAEETALYSRLLGTELRGKSAHSVHEHEVMRDLVDELEKTAMDSSGWLIRFRTLKEKVEHHLNEEEQGLFAQAATILHPQEPADLGVSFAKQKAKQAAALEA